MQIVIFSDVHGNAVALEAMLADLAGRSFDRMVCLGDAIQGGPQPAEVVHRLVELGCPVVMGNADAWLLTGEETGDEGMTAERQRKLAEIRHWSLAQLSAADRQVIAAFQPTVEIALPAGKRLLCFHGSPASFDDVILPDTAEVDFQRYLGSYAGSFLTGGHTHLQYIRRLGDAFFFNPGSVGFAYSHQQEEANFRADSWAEYAIFGLDNRGVSLTFHRVPFDTAALIRVYQGSGRPYAEDAIRQYS